MSPNRTRARRWLVEHGLSVTHERSLADLLHEAERSGEARAGVVVYRSLAFAAYVAEDFVQGTDVPPLDGVTQPTEQFADQHGPTSPVEGS